MEVNFLIINFHVERCYLSNERRYPTKKNDGLLSAASSQSSLI